MAANKHIIYSMYVCYDQNRELAVFQKRTAKHLWHVWRNTTQSGRKKPERLHYSCLMTGDPYRTVPLNNPHIFCRLDHRHFCLIETMIEDCSWLLKHNIYSDIYLTWFFMYLEVIY